MGGEIREWKGRGGNGSGDKGIGEDVRERERGRESKMRGREGN